MTVRVAACAYPIESPPDFATFAAKQAVLVREAAGQGAQLLVFPEYASSELTSVLPTEQQGELQRELVGLQPLLAAILALYTQLAREHRVYILSPSFPERLAADGGVRNRARLHAPSGAVGVVEKLQMTRFEREDWDIRAGESAPVFDTDLGLIGVAICYDSEFPLIVRRQVALGADIILVPSATDTLAGYHRVSVSCRARALENQCYVVHAPTVGEVPGSLALDANHGSAAVYGPIDYGFASDGILAMGVLDQPGWVYADLDLEALARVRVAGQVTNHADWDLPGHLEARPTRVKL
jgi:predicted amidohydrolase